MNDTDLHATLSDREKKYGSCEAHFERTANLLNVAGFRRLHPSGSLRTLIRTDWPTIIILDKIARSCEDIYHEDNPHDIGGYASLWKRVIRSTEADARINDLLR